MTKIAIAEDQKDVRENLMQILELIGEYEIIYTAGNGKILIDHLVNGPLPEVILMDLEMPEMDGIETTLWVKSKYPEISIVILTTFNQEEKVFKALKNGANGYLLKGEKPKILIEAIAQAKEGRMPMSPEIAAKTLSFFSQFQEKNLSPSDFGLTKRENEILNLLCQGLSYKEIAETCYISNHTVNAHIESIYRKLNVHSAVEASKIAVKNKWV